jgi:hypothetical protein
MIFLVVNTAAQAAGPDKINFAAKKGEIVQMQKEVSDLQEQLKHLRTRKNLQIVVATTSAVGTLVAAGFAAVGSKFFGYEGRSKSSLSEKAGSGALIVTPGAIAASSGVYAYLNSREIDQVLAQLDKTQAKLTASEKVMEHLLKD